MIDDSREWLEADGLGGFASGTASGVRTRRYHALLLPATTPPTGRMVLVNGFDAWVEANGRSSAITTQRYAPGVLHPDGASRIVAFTHEPWPSWEFQLDGGIRLKQELFVRHGSGATAIAWTLVAAPEGTSVRLRLRPLLSGRDYHSTHHENGAFRFAAEVADAVVTFRPYDGVPAVVSLSNGTYRHAPEWYRNFLYIAEQERGLDASEDLASPGLFEWELPAVGARAVWILKAGSVGAESSGAGAERFDTVCAQHTGDDVARVFDRMRDREGDRRARFLEPLDRAADAYLVQRGTGRTLVAGYPWFTDWGRDTFIAVRGLCLATGRLADARDILVQWAGAVSEGMLPNRFPDRGEALEFNAVDASLWYVVAAGELLESASTSTVVSAENRRAIESAIDAIVAGYAAGTRYGIRLDDDGLLAAGAAGLQLTWMDARVGERVITPRIGKPVEVQALWLNALWIAGRRDPRWLAVFERGRRAFTERFWDDHTGHLADVIDVDHVAGTRDDTFRPNQILAIGGLPLSLIGSPRARRIVDAVELRLLTPLGLRSLAPGEPGYAPRYEGGPSTRDAVYHQGTVWPWLMGPFVDAWVRVRGNTESVRETARRRFVEPLRQHLEAAGLGHVSEIADAEAPVTPRGCPFQAWSTSELLRIERVILSDRPAGSRVAEPEWA